MGVASLHNELLLALVGHTGDVFVRRGNERVELAGVVDWVTPPEREQLNRLALLGVHYSALEYFVEAMAAEAAGAGSTPAARCSLYRLALANGVSELLDVYRAAVLQVEAHLLRLPALPLLTVQQFLLEFEVLLPEVHVLLEKVSTQGLAGSQIMQLLSQQAHSGIPTVQSCMQRLLWHCRQVLFKQLESWLVHGLLLDRAAEFFIQRADTPARAAVDGREYSSHPAPSSPLRPGAHGATAGGQMLDWQPLEWHTGFQVSLADLPPGVSVPTGETVLFIGKAVRVLKQPMSAAASHEALHAHAEILGFSHALQQLQQQEEFSVVHFDHCVGEMRAKVSGLLWDLVQHQCDLVGQFEAIKNYFLLGRGDFYQQFLDEAKLLLAVPPKTNTAETDIALAFQQSSQKSTAEMDVFFTAFNLRWMPPEMACLPEAEGGPPLWHPARCAPVTVPQLDAWDGLLLECAVEWPLQLLFPPEVLSKYGALWQHMFRLRRVQLALEGAWATLQVMQHGKPNGVSGPRLPAALRTALWQERQRQHHFISNMALYLAMDVVDASFAQLRSAIAAAPDFSAADAAHRRYVDSLVSQAFLDMKQLMAHLEGILQQCQQLCLLVQRLAEGSTVVDEAAVALDGISRSFRVKHKIMYQIMQSGKMGTHAPALRQLLNRLDYNLYHTAKMAAS